MNRKVDGAAETRQAKRESTQGLRAARDVEEQAPEKIREGCLSKGRPVPETDTGGRVENTEALERLTVKELGKLAP